MEAQTEISTAFFTLGAVHPRVSLRSGLVITDHTNTTR